MTSAYLDACQWIEAHSESLLPELRKIAESSGRPRQGGRYRIKKWLSFTDRLIQTAPPNDKKEGQECLKRVSGLLCKALDAEIESLKKARANETKKVASAKE